jgi:hypothetical protein
MPANLHEAFKEPSFGGDKTTKVDPYLSNCIGQYADLDNLHKDAQLLLQNAAPVQAPVTATQATTTPSLQAQATPAHATPAHATPMQATSTPIQATATPMQATATPIQATATPAQATAIPSMGSILGGYVSEPLISILLFTVVVALIMSLTIGIILMGEWLAFRIFYYITALARLT